MSILRYGGVIMKDPLSRYTLRIHQDLLKKLHYVADYDGRSVNKEIEFLIRNYIAKFEERNGPIT